VRKQQCHVVEPAIGSSASPLWCTRKSAPALRPWTRRNSGRASPWTPGSASRLAHLPPPVGSRDPAGIAPRHWRWGPTPKPVGDSACGPRRARHSV
jgi:hypothetical protein